MWVDGQSFWYYLVTYVLLRGRVRDGDHPVRDARGGDVARLQDQGEVRRRAHPLRPDLAILAGLCCPACIIATRARTRPTRSSISASIFSVIFMFVALAVFLFTWERPREEIASTTDRGGRSRRSRNLDAAVRGPVRPRCASARSACTSACTSAVTSARTSSTPCSRTSSCSRSAARWSPLRTITTDGVRAAGLGDAHHLAVPAPASRAVVSHCGLAVRRRRARLLTLYALGVDRH